MTVATAAGLLGAALVGINLASLAVAAGRLSRRGTPVAAPAGEVEPVSLVRPVCGEEAFLEDTLRSGFRLDHPRYELIFCAGRADDAAVPLVRRLMAEHPTVPTRLLIGDDPVSDNPKLNNCVKGWVAARHDWIVLADSNVLMPPDYLQRLRAAWRPDSGLVCSTPLGTRPDGFWAEVECAFLNTLQARWQYTGEALGLGFAQGKSMLWYRPFLDRHGGPRALGAEIAEDAAATKLVRAAGRAVHLVDGPFDQPLGRRRLGEVWRRQTRWARLRRATFPLFFAPELFSGALPAALLCGLGAGPAGAAAALGLWYGAEAMLAAAKGWPLPARAPLAMLARDVLVLGVWVHAWIGNAVVWRGNSMSVQAKGPA